MGRLDGKVALVTGGAKGIGAASARAMAREGASVLLTDLDEDGGRAVADEIQNNGGTAAFEPQQVTDEAEWKRVVALAVERWGGLNVLMNNAGIAPKGGLIEDMELEDWRHVMAVDLDSVFLGCKHAIRAMKANGGGSIINVSSIMGIVGNTNSADYNAAKGGVRLLTKCAAVECARAGYGIRVNSVHPGFIDTPLVRNAVDDGIARGAMEGSANEVLAMLTLLHPVGRLGEPREIADAVVFLASDESSFVTGAELVIDGGYTAV